MFKDDSQVRVQARKMMSHLLSDKLSGSPLAVDGKGERYDLSLHLYNQSSVNNKYEKKIFRLVAGYYHCNACQRIIFILIDFISLMINHLADVISKKLIGN